MKDDSALNEKFTVTCTQDHTSYIPLLVKFEYKASYKAAAHDRGSNPTYKVWYGGTESAYQVFDEPEFLRYFERGVGINA